ncbi:hypothetical protein LPB41_30220 [Thalassospira sp. MA62]|nr:hypothetical protein [Thalassospira sp. MA62]
MKMYRDNDLFAVQREAERLRSEAMRKMLVAAYRKIASLFGANHKPRGGLPAGA